MNAINKRVSRLEARLAPPVEPRDEYGRTIAEVIYEARRRRLAMEGMPPEGNRQPATSFKASRRSESIAEAIWRARAARMNRATAAPSPVKVASDNEEDSIGRAHERARAGLRSGWREHCGFRRRRTLIPEGTRTAFRAEGEQFSERSDAGTSIVQQVFGLVKENLSGA
jgi:hypothetical protein